MSRFAPILCLLLAGCAYNPPNIESPANWQARNAAATETVTLPDATWWKSFSSDELNALITEAKASNYDINIAVTRILQSEASFHASQSALIPSISASGSASSTDGRESYSTSLRASYTADLFGSVRSSVAGSKVQLEATRYNRETTEISIVSQVINQYLAVLAARERIAFAENRLRNAEELMRLIETRRRVGTISDLDLVQQRNQLASQRSQIPTLRTTERSALNALAVLLGRMPEGFDVKGQSLSDVALPEVVAGIPSTLLLRRPDLRAAEASLRAAHFSVNGARAARFPSISLSASGGASSLELTSALLTDILNPVSLGLSISQTLFDSGRLAAQQESAEAGYQIQLDTYQRTVLTAFRDVENALNQVENGGIQSGFTIESAQYADEAYRLAQLQYRAGTIDFQAVLSSQNGVISAQEALVSNRLTRFSAVVTLVEALGGGWDGELREVERPVAEEM